MVKAESRKVNELECKIEKADSRLLMHVNHAAQQGGPGVVIKSACTDLHVISTYFQGVIPALISTLFSECLAHENHPNFQRSLGH